LHSGYRPRAPSSINTPKAESGVLHIRALGWGNMLVIGKDVRIDCEFRCLGATLNFLRVGLKNSSLIQSPPLIVSHAWLSSLIEILKNYSLSCQWNTPSG
jgi:hypothetical protein